MDGMERMERPKSGTVPPVPDGQGSRKTDNEGGDARYAGARLVHDEGAEVNSVTTPTLEETVAFAAAVHAGQLDKAGEEYIGHPIRVQARTERTAPAAGVDAEHAQLAALLHDVVEDTPVTLADLAARGYPPQVVAAVDALTKRPGEATKAYLSRVAANPLAVVVKRADMADNSDPVRLARLPAEQADRLATRYAGRRALLEDLVTAATAVTVLGTAVTETTRTDEAD